ncbi:MAG: peptidoglycan recognition family protein [Algisphaera sp.]
MALTRRHVVLSGLTLAAAGCVGRVARRGEPSLAKVKTPLWPNTPRGATTTPSPRRTPTRTTTTPKPTASATTTAIAGVSVIRRANWTRHGLASRNVHAMSGIKRITLHHEGWRPVTFTDASSTYDRIEQIRQIHTRDRGWSDIGYHYVIDRAGRVIEGRSATYQGAHVKQNNPHNLGVLVLGNFDRQQPSAKQLATLSRFTKALVTTYRVPTSKVRTHRELKPTECPGRYLQAAINKMRSKRQLG